MNEEEKLNQLTKDVQDVRIILARMEAKLDAASGSHQDVVEDIKDHEARLRALEADRNTDHETRIRALEKTKWALAGFAAAAGGVVGNIDEFLKVFNG